MATNTQEKELLIIPKFDEFANILHDRLHAILYHIEDWETIEKGKETTRRFTLITNLRDRSPEKAEKDVLIYAGADTQRRILNKWEKEGEFKNVDLEKLEKSWKGLKTFEYKEGDDLKEFITDTLYRSFKNNETTIERLNIGSLAPYFRRMSNPIQKHEKVVLENHFTLKGENADFFLSIPIVSLGTFDGVAHIIFQQEHLDYFLDKEKAVKNRAYNEKINKAKGVETEIEKLEQKLDYYDEEINRNSKLSNAQINQLKIEEKEVENQRNELLTQLKPHYPVKRNLLIRIIKLFAIEYDSLLLDWDLVGENIQETSRVKLDIINSTDYFEKDNKNPILKELKFPTYYRISEKYFVERLEQNNEVPKRLVEQQRRTAIITILVDSYAHNISAHSLTALNWWFRERAIFTRELKKLKEGDQYIKKGEKIVEYFLKQARKKNDKNPLIGYGSEHLSPELHPFFKFLMEKGAFWSGITRKTNFGGRRVSWYDVLWYDFINSPLYLGTIANTEGINKINLYITIYEKDIDYEGENKQFYRQRQVKEVNGQLLTGHFVTIDLWESERKVDVLEEKYEELKERSAFVQIGKAYEKLRTYLIGAQVFLSGGVVGKHAFFTVIENEIRNVKHYDLATRQKNARRWIKFSFVITIHQCW